MVLLLYKTMISTYKVASDDRLLWEREPLKPIYKLLFQTTNECGMFIKRYTGKSRPSASNPSFSNGQSLRPNLERLFSLSVSQKADEFIRGFEDLREQLDSGVAKDTLVVTLGVRDKVDILGMSLELTRKRTLTQSD